MPIWKRSKKNDGPKKLARRKTALLGLQETLGNLTKSKKKEDIEANKPQVTRINKEIAALKEKIKV